MSSESSTPASSVSPYGQGGSTEERLNALEEELRRSYAEIDALREAVEIRDTTIKRLSSLLDKRVQSVEDNFFKLCKEYSPEDEPGNGMNRRSERTSPEDEESFSRINEKIESTRSALVQSRRESQEREVLGSLSPEDREFLERLRDNPPLLVDKVFVEEFAQRLIKYPKEVTAFVAVFATLLQSNRELYAENDELAKAIMQIREEINEFMRRT